MTAMVRQTWPSWKSAKAVAVLVVAAFTIGIGSATAIYTVINTLLLKPVPYAHGERFVSLLGAQTDDPGRRAPLPVVVISDARWLRRGADPARAGRDPRRSRDRSKAHSGG